MRNENDSQQRKLSNLQQHELIINVFAFKISILFPNYFIFLRCELYITFNLYLLKLRFQVGKHAVFSQFSFYSFAPSVSNKKFRNPIR